MAFETLDISITGSSADAQSSLRSIKSSLRGLQREANDAGDSVEELGDDTTGLAARLSGLTATAGASTASLLGLSSVATGASGSLTALAVSAGTVTTALIGLAAVAAPLAATIGTIAAAAGGLATAFGAVVGSGLLAFGEERAEQNEQQLQQIRQRIAELKTLEETEEGLTDAQAAELAQLEQKAEKVKEATTVTGALAEVVGDLREEIQPLIVELGQQFVPLIADAVDALPDLVADIIDALGPLDAFRDALRDFGQAAADAIPAVVSALVDLGRQALPLVADLARVIGDGAASAFDALIRVTRQVGDDLLRVADAVGSLVPELTKTGVILIQTFAPAVDSALAFIERLLGAFNDLATDPGVRQTLTQIGTAISSLLPSANRLAVEGRKIADFVTDIINSRDVAEIFAAIRQEIIPLIPRVVELGREFKPVFAAFVDNLPAIIRGTGALADSLLDIAEVVLPVIIPPLKTLIELLGDAAAAYATFTRRSERAEQQLAEGTLIEFGDPERNSRGNADVFDDSGDGGDGPTSSITRQRASGLTPLASGGIVTGPTPAVVGEAGPEAVVPLDRLEQFLGGGPGGSQRVEIVVEEDTDIVETRIRETSEAAAEDVIVRQSDRVQQQTGTTARPR